MPPTSTATATLDHTFTATLRKSQAKGGWTYVVADWSPSFFRTKGLVKVAGTVDGHSFRGAFMPLGDGTHKLALTADVRDAIGKDEGNEATFHLTDRLS